ncbi:transposase [Chlorogloeopsis fritschii PCC 9212]|uniref:Insertion element IS402-like domain-containing protein n=1 Tax=Chlorogloeopsis fritschii PCC 6912 TaxID=211165 RepID=A0A3S1FB26_CHLFR|nr:transposase [Chlorogloeopsis fritschii]RUR74465.1 hypothetical protein PCC6912_52400 [Chlorogloeopsis fritschii PCC 6912]
MTKAYPSNLTWEQWELIAHLFPEAKPGGRPRSVSIYAIMNAIVYVLCQGCTWRGLPGDFPAWSTVYGYFRRWQKDDTWLMVHDKLYQWVRVAAGREPSPCEAAVDSQSVEAATMISIDVGYDAGKQIHGRKRHLSVSIFDYVVRVAFRAVHSFYIERHYLILSLLCTTTGVLSCFNARAISRRLLSMTIV